MPVGKESIKRAANAGAKKTVKKSVISTQDAEKMEAVFVTEDRNHFFIDRSLNNGLSIKERFLFI